MTTSPDQLEMAMARSRELAPTHHAYYEAETGKELLASDRVIVTFYNALSDSQVDEFAARYALLNKARYRNNGLDTIDIYGS